MKLSTKSQHAVTAMIDLALNDNVRTITLAEISKNQGISLSYLEQLFAKMRKAELVSGVRGPGGGYRLARKPYEITIAQIINSIDDKNKSFPIESDGSPYVSHSMWKILSHKIYEYLNQMTLADYADSRLIDQFNSEQMNPGNESLRNLNSHRLASRENSLSDSSESPIYDSHTEQDDDPDSQTLTTSSTNPTRRSLV